MQYKYWSMMTDKKFALYYINEHINCYIKWDRGINIFLAIASSAAIASWAIWQQLSFLWAIIIAASQVIVTIDKFLPYKNRIKELTEMKIRFDSIYLNIEYHWFNVAEGHLTDKEINDLIYKFLNEWMNVGKKHFLNDYLPERKRFKDRAEEKKNLYFENRFGGKKNE